MHNQNHTGKLVRKVTEALNTRNQESPGIASLGDLQNLKVSDTRITAFFLLLSTIVVMMKIPKTQHSLHAKHFT